MVRMTIATAFVVGDNHLWLLLTDDADHPFDRFVDRCLVETGGVVIVGGAGHARVAITELDQPTHVQNAYRIVELAGTHLDQIFGRGKSWVADLADGVGMYRQQRPLGAHKKVNAPREVVISSRDASAPREGRVLPRRRSAPALQVGKQIPSFLPL